MQVLRRLVARLVIGAFALAAALGIYALVKPGPLGEVEGDVLLTTTVVGVAALAALCYLAASTGAWWPAGAAGAVVAAVPVAMSLLMIWGDAPGSEGWWRTYGVTITVALTLAQVSLLAGVTGRARQRQQWLLATTALVAAAVAAIIIMMLLGDGDFGDGAIRVLGVLAILDALGSITLIALRVFGGRDDGVEPADAPLTLDRERSRRLRTRAAAQGVSPEVMLDRLLNTGDDGMAERPARVREP